MTRRTLRWLAPVAAVTVVLAVGIAHWASEKPDGLERVAEQQGFAKQERVNASAPMPEYEISALRGPMGKTAAGLLGVVLTFGLVLGVGRLVARRRRGAASPDPDVLKDPDDPVDPAGPDA